MSLIFDPTNPGGGGVDPVFGNRVGFDRGPLRHLLLGVPRRIRATQIALHTRHYADIELWTPPQRIPPEGLHIPYLPDEVFVYLQRPDRLD